MQETPIRRMNWGCGRRRQPGWINADRRRDADVDIRCDIREGLPLDDDAIDYIVSVHALQEVPYHDLVPVLRELRRVLKPGGTLRLCLPDLEKLFEAFRRQDGDFFMVPAEQAASLGGRFITHLIWYGHTRTPFTHDFIEEWLLKAGFARVERCEFGITRSQYRPIVELDNREAESLFVEAIK